MAKAKPSDTVSVEEAKAMFEENPGLDSVFSESGILFRNGLTSALPDLADD